MCGIALNNIYSFSVHVQVGPVTIKGNFTRQWIFNGDYQFIILPLWKKTLKEKEQVDEEGKGRSGKGRLAGYCRSQLERSHIKFNSEIIYATPTHSTQLWCFGSQLQSGECLAYAVSVYPLGLMRDSKAAISSVETGWRIPTFLPLPTYRLGVYYGV